jgi:hypothetical protein
MKKVAGCWVFEDYLDILRIFLVVLDPERPGQGNSGIYNMPYSTQESPQVSHNTNSEQQYTVYSIDSHFGKTLLTKLRLVYVCSL